MGHASTAQHRRGVQATASMSCRQAATWLTPLPARLALQSGQRMHAASAVLFPAAGGWLHPVGQDKLHTHPQALALGVLWPRLQLLCHPHDKHVCQAAPLVHIIAVGLLAAGKVKGADQRLLQQQHTHTHRLQFQTAALCGWLASCLSHALLCHPMPSLGTRAGTTVAQHSTPTPAAVD